MLTNLKVNIGGELSSSKALPPKPVINNDSDGARDDAFYSTEVLAPDVTDTGSGKALLRSCLPIFLYGLVGFLSLRRRVRNLDYAPPFWGKSLLYNVSVDLMLPRIKFLAVIGTAPILGLATIYVPGFGKWLRGWLKWLGSEK